MEILKSLKELANDYLKGKIEEEDKNKNKEYRLATKSIINAIQNKQKIKGKDFTEMDSIAILKNLKKKSLESISIFTKGNRLDLVEKEKIDLFIIEKFLPKELSEEETKKIVDEVFNRLKTDSIGFIMKELKVHNNINMKLASILVKDLLM